MRDEGHGDLLWVERMAAGWIERSPRWTATLAAALAVLLVGVLDGAVARIASHDFVATALYVIPVGFAAWAAGAGAGVLCAVLATAVESAARFWGSGEEVRAWFIVLTAALELLVFLGAAFTFARLRWHLEKLRHLSRTDALTGVANQRAFEEETVGEIARAGRRPAPLSLLYLDVDDFKQLNDTRGHEAGNELLRLVGRTLRETVRFADVPGRVGGDEFALLLPETGPEACRAVVERLRDGLNRRVRDAGFANTFSIGAVTFEGVPASAPALLAAADRVMYGVKHGTKDGVLHEIVAAPPVRPDLAAGRRPAPAPAR